MSVQIYCFEECKLQETKNSCCIVHELKKIVSVFKLKQQGHEENNLPCCVIYLFN